MDLDVAHLRSWIGRESESTERLAPELVRRFRATFDMAGPEPEPGDAAPRLIHFCLGQPAAPTGALGADGHPARGGFLPPVPLPRRMWAGGALRFGREIRVGDIVSRTSRISDVTVKDGRTGPLCFVTVDHRILAAGELAIEERQDLVYRGEASGGDAAPRAAPLPPPATHRRAVAASATLLFRYSALTFNGHRIHYDRSYAVHDEGYPGLVVHGPLQATWLLDFAATIRGSFPARFTFRGTAPLFDGDRISLNGTEDGDGLKLWTAREDGSQAMLAMAEWS